MSKADRNRCPLGLLGSLILIVLIERGLSRHEPVYFTNPWAADWRQAAKSADRGVNDCGILCFGDSLNKFGILPSVLEVQTGLPSFNLALNVGHPASSLFLLGRALDAGARPRAILVDFKAHLLGSGPAQVGRQFPEILRTRDWLDLLRETGDPSFATQLAVDSILASSRARFEIRAFAKASVAGNLPGDVYILPPLRRNWRVNRGAQVMSRPELVGEGEDEPKSVEAAAELFPEAWSCDPVQERYIRRFFQLAVSSGAEVFLTIPPPRPDVQERRETLGADAAYVAFIDRVLDEYPAVRVVDGRHANYAKSHCDSVHLDRYGATAYSEALGAIIARSLDETSPRDRWVALPAFGGSPIGEGIEDFAQSRMALIEAKGVLR